MQNTGRIFPGYGPMENLPFLEVTKKCMRKPSEAQGKELGFLIQLSFSRYIYCHLFLHFYRFLLLVVVIFPFKMYSSTGLYS